MNTYELIDLSLQRFTPKEVAQALGVDPKTVRRWQVRETEPKPYIADAIRQRLLPFGDPPTGEGKFPSSTSSRALAGSAPRLRSRVVAACLPASGTRTR